MIQILHLRQNPLSLGLKYHSETQKMAHTVRRIISVTAHNLPHNEQCECVLKWNSLKFRVCRHQTIATFVVTVDYNITVP